MGFFKGRINISPLLILFVYLTCSTWAKSHHVRHHRDRFKRQQGAHLYLPGSYVTDVEEPETGPWSEWSSPSPCTRTCGGGVSTQHRQCASGYSCKGPTKRHFSCNTQDCPDLADFRSQQCSEYDAVPFEDVYYQWIPYTKSPQACELNCMPRGERFYYRHKLQVIDGTRCDDETLDVCVDGKCQPVGCDMMLGSTAKEDKCRVCGGDGDTCNTMTGLLDMQDLLVGYNDILLIPAGAVNIKVREVAPSNNYLAVRNTTGYYYLNGNWRIDFPRSINFAGCKFHYDRYPQGFSAPDSITCLGPIEEALFIVLLYQDVNVGIEFEYSTPKNILHSAETETYAWTFDQFTPCSVSCGGGYQRRNVTCAGRKSLEEASSNLCNVNNKPVEFQLCGEAPCEPKWVAKDWEKCSKPCGDGGSQTRKIYCEQIISGGVPSIVDDQQCAHIQKPLSSQPCNQGVVCAEWHTGPWKPCDKLCGPGKETRKVTCFRREKKKIVALEDWECSHVEKPETEKKCLLRPCEGVDWVTSEWSGCEDKCGLNKETRNVICATASGDVYDNKLCEETEIKPPSTRECEQKAKDCDFEWHAGQWSDCSAKCGGGVQTRKVFCLREVDDGFKKVDPSNCDKDKKYEDTRNCTGEVAVCPGEWFSGPWTECSKQCGGGLKTRKVICMNQDVVVNVKECDKDVTPFSTEECNKQPCDKEQPPSSSSTTTKEISEAPAELTTLPDKEQSERDVELIEDEYELVDDDICEDGEFVMVDDKAEIKLGIGEAVEYHKETKETTLSLDDLMLSDSTYVSDGIPSLSVDYGSGDYEFTKTTGGDLGSTAFDTSISEGSGDDTTYFKSSDEITSATTEMEGSGSMPTEVTEPEFVKKTAYTVSGEDVTTEFTDISEISTEKEKILTTIEDGEVTSSGTTEALSVTEAGTSETGVTKMETGVSETEVTKTEVPQTETSQTEVTKIDTEVTETDSTKIGVTESEITKIDQSTIETSITDVSGTEISVTEISQITTMVDEDTTKSSITTTGELTDGTTLKESTEEETTQSTVDKSSETTESATEVSETTPIQTTEAAEENTKTTKGDSTDTSVVDTTEKTETIIETTGVTEEDFDIYEVEPEEPSTKTPEAFTTLPALTDISTEVSTQKESETTSIGETGATIEAITSVSETVGTESGSTVGVTTERAATESIRTESIGTESIGTESIVTESVETESVVPERVTTESVVTESVVTESGATKTIITEVTSTGAVTTEKDLETVTTDTITTEKISTDKSTIGIDVTEPSEVTETGITDKTTISEVVKTTIAEGTTLEIESIEGIFTTEDLYQLITTTISPMVAMTTKIPRTTKPGIEEIFPIKPKQRMCKRRKRVSCKETEFGCCLDKITPAKGPFNQGCPSPKTCDETIYGCCEDGVSPSEGSNYEGCPESQCKETLFGCCPDNKTPSEGNDNEGCPPLCALSKFGCCTDNITEASGPNKKGCPEEEKKEKEKEMEELSSTTESVSTTTTTEAYVDCNISKYGCCPDGVSLAEGENFKGCDIFKDDCNDSLYGCCPDGVSSAHGPRYQGCDTECSKTQFGCCADGVTPAHGYLGEGCCLSSQYGCCPDNIKEAEGPKFKGCSCQNSPYGCCPDNTTSAKGPENEGCGCQHTPHGCCADNHTPATGANFTGCLCHTFQFGCCPDGITAAQGPHQQGCGCRNTEFGCCSDEQTAAKGANFEGCDCASSKFGCCLDGVTEAQGENFDGCRDIPENLQASCSQEKERGPCRNYTVKWFYDMQYGGCSRFWYGGCEGNGNRFKDKNECNAVCVEPEGKDKCKLPMVAGPCEGYYPQWYYDKEHNHCAQFIYGGCLGNNNRFETVEECNNLCVKDRNIDACDQPKEEGSCRGNYYRWYFDKEEGVCQPFRYGGCEGNNNNFHTELACKQKCAQEGKKKEHCSLPRARGNCTERLSRWYYDTTEKRCMPFYYSGCHGNKNSFDSEHRCETDCPKDIVKDTCHLPAELGDCSDYRERWYYDTAKKECRRFYYGGCGGNGNNFENEDVCLARCSPEAQTETPPPPAETETPVVTEPFKTEFCFLSYETGPCRKSEARWYYDRDGACKQFLYGGCQGNRNNFKTTEECSKMCENAQDRCSLPKLIGPCDAQYPQWYYNQTTDMCEEFVFGGCMGNRNRFDDQVSCERECRKGPPTVTEGPEDIVPHVDDLNEICYKPVDEGNCTDNIPAYYYDARTGRCLAFTYRGCGGNANRYTSEEQCERQCGSFRGEDVCSLPKEEGPCRTYHLKFYYDTSMGQCAQFYYGGCDGNGNRFSTVEECQSICVSTEEKKPERPSSEICLLPADIGNCRDGDLKRWYFDETRGECMVFIYSGCGGNFNRFKSLQACRETCRDYLPPTYPETQQSTTDATSMENPCQEYIDQCKRMNCPYGIKAYVDDTQCNRCKCDDPCEGMSCPAGTQCGVEVNLERSDGNDANFIGVCREYNKTGECPVLTGIGDKCEQECRTDADCTSTLKCCSNGCGTECMRPAATTVTPPGELRTPSYLPSFTDVPAHYYPPQVIEEEFQPEVIAGEGDYVMLRCAVSGNPNPKFSWKKDNLLIDGTEPRFRLTLDGSALQIISLYKTDSGIYFCTADNKIGQPLTKEIKLTVQDPVEGPAHILDDPELSATTVSLGTPATLHCYVYGYPSSSVAWFKEDTLIPMKTEEFTINKDSSLYINSVRLRNLGVYTCQAYNGIGKPSSWSVTVQALGPVYSTDPNDKKYMKYVIDRPRRPGAASYPTYPFRPTRETPAITLSTTRLTPTTPITTTTTVTTPRPRPRLVPVRANITLKETKFSIKSRIHIPCEVDGYPLPQVQWYKDGEPIRTSDRIEITANYRLIINDAVESDTGEYRCEARNDHSSATSTTPLLIRGQQIPPNCTDNAFFANCKLIVDGKFCKHLYYAKFCCKSCTEAGQLDPQGPHLNDQPAALIDSNLV